MTATRKRAAPEKRVQSAVVKNLRAMGWFVTSFSQPQRAMMTAGVPDLCAMHWKYGTIWIEVKAPGGKCRTAQLAWHGHARKSGARVIVVDSIDSLVGGLKELGVQIQ